MKTVVHESPKGAVTRETKSGMSVITTYRRGYDGALNKRPAAQEVASQYSLCDAEAVIKDQIYQLEN